MGTEHHDGAWSVSGGRGTLAGRSGLERKEQIKIAAMIGEQIFHGDALPTLARALRVF